MGLVIDLERKSYVELIRQWGGVNTDGLLEESCQKFFIPEAAGFIGYRVENSQAIVFGDPVCSEENKPLFARKFQEKCREDGLGVMYSIVTLEFAKWLHENMNAPIFEWGENFILNPFENPVKGTGSNAVLVRKKVKHALKDGVIVQEYLGTDLRIEEKISKLADGWVEKRKGPQIFLAHVSLFQNRIGKRWFYAEKEGDVVGFLVLNEIQSKKGWLLNNVMLSSNAPNGVSELLIISTLETLERENCHYVIAGPVPIKDLKEIQGLNPALEYLVRLMFKGAKYIFHLDGYQTYWHKFNPKSEGSYLAFPENNIGYSSVVGLMRAYNMNIG